MMIQLSYSVTIDAAMPTVWRAITDPALFPDWARAFAEGSQVSGTWEEGGELRFTSPDGSGTRARIDVLRPPARIETTHLAVIQPDGGEDTESDAALDWISTREIYTLEPAGKGGTSLVVTVKTTGAYLGVFDAGWPKALALLREVAEGLEASAGAAAGD
jgi:uncharacterized protein YndB with AHSA1/START domain